MNGEEGKTEGGPGPPELAELRERIKALEGDLAVANGGVKNCIGVIDDRGEEIEALEQKILVFQGIAYAILDRLGVAGKEAEILERVQRIIKGG